MATIIAEIELPVGFYAGMGTGELGSAEARIY
jgi:hypothetical protein